jgi:hypothetical protein
MDSESGVTLVFTSMENDLPVNEDLVSGLLTALNQFTIVEFKQPIESIEMGGLRWAYVIDNDTGLLFIAAEQKNVSAEILRSRLIVIQQSFTTGFVQDKSWKDDWNGNIEIFRPFKKTIDEYYDHWKQAENITTIAEFFDILGIFQQILNLLMNVIETRIPTEKRIIVYQHLERLFDTFSRTPYVQKDEGLSNITFTRDGGFNIISINPSNCDMLLVEKEIINITKAVVSTIKRSVGNSEAVTLFVEEKVFEYILGNLTLLSELNLEPFLLNLFLLG